MHTQWCILKLKEKYKWLLSLLAEPLWHQGSSYYTSLGNDGVADTVVLSTSPCQPAPVGRSAWAVIPLRSDVIQSAEAT
eukprot:SAG31_NODE_65_length_28565_cov_8.402914_16_plen_79_part_00